jgi:hypothetical protein
LFSTCSSILNNLKHIFAVTKISSYYPTRDFAAAAAPVTSNNANAFKQARENHALFLSINTSSLL